MKRMKWGRTPRVIGWALVFAGCGDLTAGGLGEVEVYATSDDPGGAPATAVAPMAAVPVGVAGDDPSPHAAPSLAHASQTAALSLFEGLLATEIRVYLQSDASSQWLELTDGVRDLTLDLSGNVERRVAVKFVDAGRYTRLRVVFSRVEATVLGGLIIGGVPVTGPITVDLGAQGSLTVEREALVEVEGDQALDLVLDLNVDVWLPTASILTRTVAASALSNALALRVR